MKLVTPHVKQGGMSLAYVMVTALPLLLQVPHADADGQPNLSPPITTVETAVAYRAQLEAIEPSVQFMMTLFLSPSLTPEEIIKAKQAGIAGVKSYPRGVTTGSESGVESYERYYPVFAEMERQDLVLNLHGEVPSSASTVRPGLLPSCNPLHVDTTGHISTERRSSFPHPPPNPTQPIP